MADKSLPPNKPLPAAPSTSSSKAHVKKALPIPPAKNIAHPNDEKNTAAESSNIHEPSAAEVKEKDEPVPLATPPSPSQGDSVSRAEPVPSTSSEAAAAEPCDMQKRTKDTVDLALPSYTPNKSRLSVNNPFLDVFDQEAKQQPTQSGSEDKESDEENGTPVTPPAKLVLKQFTPPNTCSEETSNGFRQLFDLPQTEDLYYCFSCVKDGQRFTSGRLFVGSEHVCFHSKLMGRETRDILAYRDIRHISPHKVLVFLSTFVMHSSVCCLMVYA